VTLPYLAELSRLGVREAVERDPALALGVNTAGGSVVNAAVAEALGKPLADAGPALSGAVRG
jgi:alanine dehydrogenase